MAFSNIIRNTISTKDGYKNPGSILTNPIDGTILASSGNLSPGNYIFGFIVTTSVAMTMDIQHRNSTDTGNIDSIRIRIAQAGTDYPFFPSKVRINAQDEKIRCVLVGGIIGEVQTTEFHIEVV